MPTAKPSLNLTTRPETVNWPQTHYAFIEKVGPFQNTAQQAWNELQQVIPAISQNNKITGFTSLFKVGPQIYRAGVCLSAKPHDLPAALQYTEFHGGKYSRFILAGPYSNLPEACGRVFKMVEDQKIPVRDDFYLENYVNDPKTTAESELITEILVPTA
jgi:DNA gyrase inhibitor GyrI